MVNLNPKLSLPTDLPYKKRQRPFNPNTPLQQATVRYNEAIRKRYNDIQFAKRCESGCVSQNELTSVNTRDLLKEIDPDLFTEMSNLNSLPVHNRQRKFKRAEVPSGNIDVSTPVHGILLRPAEECGCRPLITTTTPAATDPIRVQQYDCNNIEMFPPLETSAQHEPDKSIGGRGVKHAKTLSPRLEQSTQSLETEAINEYEPTEDSAHDMIFGNVMGIDYGNYIHDRLWPDQTCLSNNCQNQLKTLQQNQHHPISEEIVSHGQGTFQFNLCKSASFNLSTLHQNNRAGDVGESTSGTLSDIEHCALASTSVGSTGRRSTSVPRPRTGSRKETMKQAAIRCGIIQGNQTVPAIPQRSHYLVPLQLPIQAVQSDPMVQVLELYHPRSPIPTCSSAEVMPEDMKHMIADVEFKRLVSAAHTTTSNVNLLQTDSSSTEPKCELLKIGNPNGRLLLSQVRTISDFRPAEAATKK